MGGPRRPPGTRPYEGPGAPDWTQPSEVLEGWGMIKGPGMDDLSRGREGQGATGSSSSFEKIIITQRVVPAVSHLLRGQGKKK